MPVWHVSISLQSPRGELLASPGRLERAAIALLRGVGGGREWWLWNPKARVGHLRVAVTQAEHQQIPPAAVVADAGPSGPERRRNPP
jgi:hypothetical protein